MFYFEVCHNLHNHNLAGDINNNLITKALHKLSINHNLAVLVFIFLKLLVSAGCSHHSVKMLEHKHLLN